MKTHEELIQAALDNPAITAAVNMRLHQHPAVPWDAGCAAVFRSRLKETAEGIAASAHRSAARAALGHAAV